MLTPTPTIVPAGCIHRYGGNLEDLKSDDQDRIQFCPCPFCQYAQTDVKPMRLVRGENDYTKDERLMREELLSKIFTDNTNRDLCWVLNNMRQPLSGVPQLHLLIPETLFFKRGVTEALVYSSIRPGLMGTLAYETGPVIKITNLRKLFAHSHCSLNLFPFDEKRNNLFKVGGNMISGGFKDNKEKIMQTLTQEKFRTFMKNLNSENTSFLKKFCEQSKIDWIQDFRVTVSRQKKYCKDKTTEFPHEIFGYKEFIDLAQTPLVRKVWKELVFIQRFPKLLRGDITVNRIRFDLNEIRDVHLFKRASYPVLSGISALSENNSEFTTHEQELAFLSQLMESDGKRFRLYTVYKIYQAILNFTRIRLSLFFAEFSEDLFGGIYLTDLKIFKIESEEDLGVYEAWNVIQQRIIKLTSPITVGAEIGRLDKELKALEERKVIQQQEEARMASKPSNLQIIPQTEEQRTTRIDEVQKAMMQGFKRNVLKNMGEERMVVDEKFLRLKESADEIYAKLQPKFKEKLSKITFKPLSEYQKDQKSKLGTLTLKPNISGVKRPSRSSKNKPVNFDSIDSFSRQTPKSSSVTNQILLKVLKEHSEELDSKVDGNISASGGKPYIKNSYRKMQVLKGGSSKNQRDKTDQSKLFVLKSLTDQISKSVDSRPSKFEVKIHRQSLSRSIDPTGDTSRIDTDRRVATILARRFIKKDSISADKYRLLR